jgi:hypothetical protein
MSGGCWWTAEAFRDVGYNRLRHYEAARNYAGIADHVDATAWFELAQNANRTVSHVRRFRQ